MLMGGEVSTTVVPPLDCDSRMAAGFQRLARGARTIDYAVLAEAISVPAVGEFGRCLLQLLGVPCAPIDLVLYHNVIRMLFDPERKAGMPVNELLIRALCGASATDATVSRDQIDEFAKSAVAVALCANGTSRSSHVADPASAAVASAAAAVSAGCASATQTAFDVPKVIAAVERQTPHLPRSILRWMEAVLLPGPRQIAGPCVRKGVRAARQVVWQSEYEIPTLRTEEVGALLDAGVAWLLSVVLPDTYRSVGCWDLLYNSRAHGTSGTAFRSRVLKYPAATILLVRCKSGAVYGGAVDTEWEDAGEFGGDACRAFALLPKLDVFKKQCKGYYVSRSRSARKGLGFGTSGNFGVFLEAGLSAGEVRVGLGVEPGLTSPVEVVAIEVWGCGGDAAAKTKSGREKVGAVLVAKAGKAKFGDLSGGGVLDGNAEDKALLELAGIEQHSTAIREIDASQKSTEPALVGNRKLAPSESL